MYVAFGYMRYSSKMQGAGSALHRQKSLINKWVEDQKVYHGKNYEVQFYTDKGLSGWTGENLVSGALGRLIEEVEAGCYLTGTPIVVESIDRLSRQGHTETAAILRRLTSKGCVVHSILDRQVIHHADLETMSRVMQIMAIAERGREESDIKSKRVSASKVRNHELARQGKKLVTRHIPGWLYLDEKGKLRVDSEKQKIVKTIFEMRLAGNTFQAIADYMNGAHVPVLNTSKGAKHWLPNSVRTLLHNRSTIGYLAASRVNPTLTEIADYFPPVITNDLFYSVNAISVPAVRSSYKKEKPYYPENVYLFRKLVRCRYCGGNVFPNGAKAGYWGRLRCMGHHNKTCEAPPISRYDFENALVTRMFPLLKSMEISSEENPVLVLQTKIDHLENSINNLMDQMETSTSQASKRHLGQRMDQLSDEQEKLQRQIVTMRLKRGIKAESSPSDLDFNSYTDRLKMQIIINRNIERIVLDAFFDKVHIKLVNGNVLMDFPLFRSMDVSQGFTAVKVTSTIPEEIEELLGLSGTLPTVFSPG